MSDDQHLAIAEREIREILIRLEEKTARDIDTVNVDTRNWAGMRVEIFLKQKLDRKLSQ